MSTAVALRVLQRLAAGWCVLAVAACGGEESASPDGTVSERKIVAAIAATGVHVCSETRPTTAPPGPLLPNFDLILKLTDTAESCRVNVVGVSEVGAGLLRIPDERERRRQTDFSRNCPLVASMGDWTMTFGGCHGLNSGGKSLIPQIKAALDENPDVTVHGTRG